MKDALTWGFSIMSTMSVAMTLNNIPKAKLSEVKFHDIKREGEPTSIDAV